jgi:hypothetical protein
MKAEHRYVSHLSTSSDLHPTQERPRCCHPLRITSATSLTTTV